MLSTGEMPTKCILGYTDLVPPSTSVLLQIWYQTAFLSAVSLRDRLVFRTEVKMRILQHSVTVNTAIAAGRRHRGMQHRIRETKRAW